jgi:hypothetical protein
VFSYLHKPISCDLLVCSWSISPSQNKTSNNLFGTIYYALEVALSISVLVPTRLLFDLQAAKDYELGLSEIREGQEVESLSNSMKKEDSSLMHRFYHVDNSCDVLFSQHLCVIDVISYKQLTKHKVRD